MKNAPFRVGFIEPPMYASFVETMEAAEGIELVHLGTLSSPVEQVLAKLRTCHGFYVTANRDELPRPLHISRTFLAAVPDLLLVATYGAGYDTVDLPACTEAGVAVANQAGGNARAVAEHAVGMMLTLLKRIPQAHAALRAGSVNVRERLMGRELADRTVGVVGLGNIGACSAAIVRGFGCTVLAYDPYLDAAACAALGATKVELGELLARSDVVTVHCPLNAATRGLFDAGKFAAMRPGAIFVNTSRGSTYDEAALAAALDSGHLDGAGLDVWEKEPPAPDHPLVRHPCVIASPHTAGVTHESRNRVAMMAAQCFVDAAAGRLPARCLNPELKSRWLERLHAVTATTGAGA